MSIDWANSRLKSRVDELCAEHGDTVPVSEIGGIVASLLETAEGKKSPAELVVQQEMQGLLDLIHRARAEVVEIGSPEIRDQHIPVANDELDAVVAETEAAADAFLSAAERLEALAEEADADGAEKLTDVATSIYEASSFQDITGQRIGKVVGALQQIERRVLRMSKLIQGEQVPDEEPKVVDNRPDAELLNGPGLADGGSSQEDIDALLASFD
ncbi:MAG: protein phosphatase CheZ [Alphaproteobacteria bacterium]